VSASCRLPQRNWSGVAVCLIVVSIVGACAKSPQEVFYEACRNGILMQLKAPATARFAKAPDMIWLADTGSSGFLKSHVDAQNAYGALLRTRFLCGRDLGRFRGVYALFEQDTTGERYKERVWRELLTEAELVYEYAKAQTEDARKRPQTASLLPRYEELLKEAEHSYKFAKAMATLEEATKGR
jgi:hypothetical protein